MIRFTLGLQRLESRTTPTFFGGVNVSTGDVNNDAFADVITGAGAGGGPHVRVLSGQTGQELRSFFAYDSGFPGGVFTAAGDVGGEGSGDIVTGAGAGGGPHVKAFDGVTGAEVRSFFAYDPTFAGGVSVAAADLDGDGFAEVVTGAGAGGGPHVKVFDGATGAEVRSFFAYDPTFTGGVNVAAAGLDGFPAGVLVTGTASGPSQVRQFRASDVGLLKEVSAYDPAFTGGVNVAAGDFNGDSFPDLFTGAGPGGGPHVRALTGFDLTSASEFFAFGAAAGSAPAFAVPAGSAPGPDADVDSLSDMFESFFGTDPNKYDTDGDLLPDGFEAQNAASNSAPGLNPTTPDPDPDLDLDGLTALQEDTHKTNPKKKDSDGDEVDDKTEVEQGSNPRSPDDRGQPPLDGLVADVTLSVGDHSGSHSERYNLEFKPANPNNRFMREVLHQAPRFGEVETNTYKLYRGAHEIRILHRGSNLSDPDFDYTATINVAGSGVQVIANGDVLGVHGESSPFYADGKTVRVFLPSPAGDIDFTFLSNREGGRFLNGYLPRNSDGSVAGSSGVTIATGVDLGGRTTAEIDGMNISDGLKTLLKGYDGLGKKFTGQSKAEADAYLAANPLTITDAQAAELEAAIKGGLIAGLISKYDAAAGAGAWAGLPSAAKTVIVSVAYQYTSNGDLGSATPNFWTQVTAKDWKGAVNNLRNFGDSYPTRRNTEADLLETLVNPWA